MSVKVLTEVIYVMAGAARLESYPNQSLGRHLCRNLVILNFVRAHLVFIGQPAKAHVQYRIGAIAREATTSIGLFSKI